MKTYSVATGFRHDPKITIWVSQDNGTPAYPLAERRDLDSNSADGFDWGHAGSGPAQLALAILADLYDDAYALQYQDLFKFRVIVPLPPDEGWQLEEGEIRTIMQDIEQRGVQALNGRR